MVGNTDDADGRSGIVAVRPPLPDDAAALALAHVRAWQTAYRGLMPQRYLDSLVVEERTESWRRRLSNQGNDSQLLVGTIDDKVAGFAMFGAARDPESGEAGELYALNVHPNHWGGGVGSALLSASHAGLAEFGFLDAVLWVVPGNDRARRFYERHGWKVEKRERTIELQGVTVPEIRYERRVP